MQLRSFSLSAVALGLFFGLAGCGGANLKTVKVPVTVTLDGRPLEGATISLLPVAADGGETTGRPASGLTGSDGTCNLSTFSTGDGVVPGNYKITVSKEEIKDSYSSGGGSRDPSEQMKNMYGGFVKDMAASKGAQKKNKNQIPASYADASKTPYKNVKLPPPEGKLTLELKSTGGS